MAKKIMIIDDDPDVVLFLSTVLQDHGYQTVGARNGQEGLERLKSERVDLILLDLMMPYRSGISLLTHLKESEDLSNIPVIMVTGVSGETGIDLNSFFERKPERGKEDYEPLLEGYLEKPVDRKKLLMMVKKAVK